jgi:hypothetical protein
MPSHRSPSPTGAHTQGTSLKFGRESCFLMSQSTPTFVDGLRRPRGPNRGVRFCRVCAFPPCPQGWHQREDTWHQNMFCTFSESQNPYGPFEMLFVVSSQATAKVCSGKKGVPHVRWAQKNASSHPQAPNAGRQLHQVWGTEVSTLPVDALDGAAAHEGSSKVLASPANCSDKTC